MYQLIIVHILLKLIRPDVRAPIFKNWTNADRNQRTHNYVSLYFLCLPICPIRAYTVRYTVKWVVALRKRQNGYNLRSLSSLISNTNCISNYCKLSQMLWGPFFSAADPYLVHNGKLSNKFVNVTHTLSCNMNRADGLCFGTNRAGPTQYSVNPRTPFSSVISNRDSIVIPQLNNPGVMKKWRHTDNKYGVWYSGWCYSTHYNQVYMIAFNTCLASDHAFLISVL